MGVHEVVIGYQYIYATLSPDSLLTGYAPGGVHRSLAPPETQPPFVVMSYQSGQDVLTMNAFRTMVSAIFQVKCVGPASMITALANAAARIDALLGSPPTSGTATGGLVAASYRESPIALDEIVAGEVWSNWGGMYRMLIEQTS